MHTHVHTLIHPHNCMHIHVDTRRCAHVIPTTHKCIHTCTNTHARFHTHVHTKTQTHASAHTLTQAGSFKAWTLNNFQLESSFQIPHGGDSWSESWMLHKQQISWFPADKDRGEQNIHQVFPCNQFGAIVVLRLIWIHRCHIIKFRKRWLSHRTTTRLCPVHEVAVVIAQNRKCGFRHKF